MTLAAGPDFLMIPGPTTVPARVLRAMNRPAVDIYTGPLLDITASCLTDLKQVFRTKGTPYIYAANGHGAWEAALSNTLSSGDKVLVLESGRFAIGWGEMASLMGLEVEVLPGAWDRAVDPNALEARLRADKTGEIKAILTVQIDTASGVLNDVEALSAAIKAAGHEALFMVDGIASIGIVPFEMDDWGVDLALTGSQKGLMTPPGLSFVAAGARARDAHKSAGLRTHYWDWTFRDGPEHYHKYCGTPPEHLLFGFREALDMLFEEGMAACFERHRLLASAVRRAIDVWAQAGGLSLNIAKEAERANSVTMILTPHFDPSVLMDFCRLTCNVTLGIGLAQPHGRGFRIGHMGHVNAPAILGALGTIELGLKTLGLPAQTGGVDAAIEILSAALRDTSKAIAAE